MLSHKKLIYARNSLADGNNMLLKMSKITSKGQVTIPVEVRRALGLDVGDTILFEKIDGNIVIKKNKKGTLLLVLEEAGPLSNETRKVLNKIRDE